MKTLTRHGLVAVLVASSFAQRANADAPIDVAAMRSEVKANLRSIFTAQKSHFADKDSYGRSFQAIGFSPAAGNRYTYFLAPSGATERRDGKAPKPAEAVIIGVDETKHRDVKPPADLLKSECPITSRPGANGVALPVGVSGVAPDQDFIAVAAGNLDGDAELDCWSVASFDRTLKDGTKVLAGTPIHEKNDVPNLK